VRACSRQRVV